jgi:probable phosphoglycerate mutase
MSGRHRAAGAGGAAPGLHGAAGAPRLGGTPSRRGNANRRGVPAVTLLRFVRHGATAADQAGLLCGGDLDLPLTALGREQALQAGRRIALLEPAVGLIVTSDLMRTRETAALVAAALPDVPIIIEPAFSDRRLGEWNLRPESETQPWMDAGQTPPGGESVAAFADRIAAALRHIRQQLVYRPVLVGSRDVAALLCALVGMKEQVDLHNGVTAEFDLAEQPCLHTNWSAL